MSKQFAKGNKKAPGNNPMKTLKRMIAIYLEIINSYSL